MSVEWFNEPRRGIDLLDNAIPVTDSAITSNAAGGFDSDGPWIILQVRLQVDFANSGHVHAKISQLSTRSISQELVRG